MTSSSRGSDKSSRYLQQLDLARCNSQWDQVPELARKVGKHAPSRKVLVLTAKLEATIATTSVVDARGVLPPLIDPLLAAIDGKSTHLDDIYQAKVCLGWIHWTLRESQLAATRLPKDLAKEYEEASSKDCASPQWLQVCASKAAYIKGFSMDKAGDTVNSLGSYNSVIPFISSKSTSSLGDKSQEFRLWTERLLTRYIASYMRSQILDDSADYEKLLQVFHLWTALFKFYPTGPKPAGRFEPTQPLVSLPELGLEVEFSRWDMWTAYYATLSELLRRGFVYSPTYSDTNPEINRTRDGMTEDAYRPARLKQRAELKAVEARMETKLLNETSFPKANARNERVERWIDSVMENWRVLCGTTWSDDELGEGGKNAVARGILDILYRAATKTFHSTQILRHLFAVHAYLVEFDLAMKALDSYLEIISRGRARAEKSAEPDYSLDSNDQILTIGSEAIGLLCRYGHAKEAEKAREIASKVSVLLEEIGTQPSIPETAVSNGNTQSSQKHASPLVISAAYHALGLSEAHWARMTHEAAKRTEHQTKALAFYRQALDRRYGNSKNLNYQYSLAVLLAETRDIPGATKVVKMAITEGSAQQDFSDLETFKNERQLVRFWHLLTLLLTTRSDLTGAVKTSTAAFEQFLDPQVLSPQPEYRSEHLQESESAGQKQSSLLARMSTFEKDGILQLKITQIALLEALEGPDAAVDATAELLNIYARLFGLIKIEPPKTAVTVKPPKSAVGSLTASIFKRARSRRGNRASIIAPSENGVARPSTVATSVAPTIQVTDASNNYQPRGRTSSGQPRGEVHRQSHSRGEGSEPAQRSVTPNRLHKRNSVRDSMESFRPRSPTTDYREPLSEEEVVNGDTREFLSSEASHRPSTADSDGGTSYATAEPTTEALSAPVTTSLPLQQRPLSVQTSRQSMASFVSFKPRSTLSISTNPAPAFPESFEKKHKKILLVELWLFVAGLYSRDGKFDDAKSAVDEAAALTNQLEGDVSRLSSTAKAFAARGWGNGRSVDELWGDVWAQRGELSRANGFPHEAISNFEEALSLSPNHAKAIVGISELLLDIYEEKIPPEPVETPGSGVVDGFSPSESQLAELLNAERPRDLQSSMDLPRTPATIITPATASSPPTLSRSQTTASDWAVVSRSTELPVKVAKPSAPAGNGHVENQEDSRSISPPDPPPELLNRLAARDRAYHLLSTLTKLGTGWDYAEAWFLLARAYELSGQIEKAKEVLWWCVELEDSRPLRSWKNVGLRAFAL